MTLIPVQVSFRGLAHSEAIESIVRQRVAWLEQFHPSIVRCRVVLELPHRHRRNGRHFHSRIEITMPGTAPIVVHHEPSLHGALKAARSEARHKETDIAGDHRDVRITLHDAFDAARRRIEDTAREQRHFVKTHAHAATDGGSGR
jgi:hypothetical protein